MERYWLIGGGVVLAVLLVASVALALAGGETRFDPSSPEHAVQQYVKALAGEDFDAAEAMWSPDLRENCSIALFAVDARRSLDNLSEARITLDEAKAVGETTIVSLRVIRTTGGGVFGPSEFENTYSESKGSMAIGESPDTPGLRTGVSGRISYRSPRQRRLN